MPQLCCLYAPPTLGRTPPERHRVGCWSNIFPRSQLYSPNPGGLLELRGVGSAFDAAYAAVILRAHLTFLLTVASSFLERAWAARPKIWRRGSESNPRLFFLY